MRTPFDQRELEALAERFQSVRRVRVYHRTWKHGHASFLQFTQDPERYEAVACAKIDHWTSCRVVEQRFPHHRNLN